MNWTVILCYFRVAFIYHLAKDSVLKRANTVMGGLGSAILPTLPSLDSPDTASTK